MGFLGFGGNKEPNPNAPTTGQRMIGAGLTAINPIVGMLYRGMMGYRNRNNVGGIYSGMGSGYSGADRAAIRGPAIDPSQMQGWNSSPNLGFGMTPQAGSDVSNQQLSDRLDNMSNEAMAARLQQARQQAGQSGQTAGPQAPQTSDEARRANNAQYLDMATSLANNNYGQDIAYMTPHARTARQK